MFNQQASVMQMALKAVLTEDEFGELDETTAGFYEWDGEGQRYRLSVDDIDSHPEVNKLRSSHQRSKKEREEARKKALANQQNFVVLESLRPKDQNDPVKIQPAYMKRHPDEVLVFEARVPMSPYPVQNAERNPIRI